MGLLGFDLFEIGEDVCNQHEVENQEHSHFQQEESKIQEVPPSEQLGCSPSLKKKKVPRGMWQELNEEKY